MLCIFCTYWQLKESLHGTMVATPQLHGDGGCRICQEHKPKILNYKP